MLFQYKKIILMVDGSLLKFVLALLTNYMNAWVSYNFYMVIVALVTYFVAAGMNIGFDIKIFGRMAAKALCFSPIMALLDMIGLMIFNSKFIEMGIRGWLVYIPFFIIFSYVYYQLIPAYLEIKERNRKILGISALLAILLASYPY